MAKDRLDRVYLGDPTKLDDRREFMAKDADLERKHFLEDLDNADHIDLPDWEAQFVGDCMKFRLFSPKQRGVIDRLRERYESQIKSSPHSEPS